MKKTLMAFVLFCVSLACAFPLLANPVVSDPSYSVELVASNLGFACGVAIGPTGDIFVSGYEGPIFGINKVTYAVTTYDFGFIYGMNLVFDSAGTLFALSGDGNPRVLNKVLSFNPPTSSYFSQGYHTVGLAVGPGGYIYLGNTGDGTISRVGPSGGIAETILTGLPGVRGVREYVPIH